MKTLLLLTGATTVALMLPLAPARAEMGTLLYDAPVRWPGSGRMDWPAAGASVLVNGSATTASDDGSLTWAGFQPATITAQSSGARVAVINAAGPAATTTFLLQGSGSQTWSAAATADVDAQLSAFIHGERARAYCKNIAPGLALFDRQIQITVNAGTPCDAHPEGAGVVFGVGSTACENMARLPDVVYRTFGRLLYEQAVAQGSRAIDAALSHGAGDYLAATMTGDPGVAPGMRRTAEPWYQIDPAGSEHLWPKAPSDDDATRGLVIAGALWDLRKLLVAKAGAAAGVAAADRLFYGGVKSALDIPTMYPAVLAADDEDGVASNGTPNECEIKQAFAAHGLYARVAAAPNDPRVVAPDANGFDVALKLLGVSTRCVSDRIVAAKLRWHPGTDAARSVESVMTYDAAQAVVAGHIPSQPPGQVVRYQVELTFADATTTTLPADAAAPFYLLTVGPAAQQDAGADGGTSDAASEAAMGAPDAGGADAGVAVADADAGAADASSAADGGSGEAGGEAGSADVSSAGDGGAEVSSAGDGGADAARPDLLPPDLRETDAGSDGAQAPGDAGCSCSTSTRTPTGGVIFGVIALLLVTSTQTRRRR